VITALLLAAGSARRFGAPKLVQEIDARPVIRWCVESLLASDVDDVLIVVPPDHDAITSALAGTGAGFVVNPDHERGIGTSIATGVAALGDDTAALLVALADEPFVEVAVIHRVMSAYRRSRTERVPAIVAPRYGAVPGHPVLFDRSVFGELRALDGDHGARSVIDRDSARVTIVQIDGSPPGDIDTPEDLARMRSERQYMSRQPPSSSRDR
jgi:molybdenum cofactor cytidylyltransferase